MNLQIRLSFAAVVLLTCFSLLSANPVHAQERLDLYADNAMTQCSLSDTSPGLKFVYVFLNGPVGALGVGFIAPRPACWAGATWITDILPGPRGWVGNTQTDFFTTLIPPGDPTACATGPVLVCSILFQTTGTAPSCCQMSVAPIQTSNSPNLPLYYIPCNNPSNEVPLPIGEKVTINPDATCPCGSPVATQQSTWGRVKSLYR